MDKLLGVVLLIIILSQFLYPYPTPNTPEDVVKKTAVIQDNIFEITLDDGTRCVVYVQAQLVAVGGAGAGGMSCDWSTSDE